MLAINLDWIIAKPEAQEVYYNLHLIYVDEDPPSRFSPNFQSSLINCYPMLLSLSIYPKDPPLAMKLATQIPVLKLIKQEILLKFRSDSGDNIMHLFLNIKDADFNLSQAMLDYYISFIESNECGGLIVEKNQADKTPIEILLSLHYDYNSTDEKLEKIFEAVVKKYQGDLIDLLQKLLAHEKEWERVFFSNKLKTFTNEQIQNVYDNFSTKKSEYFHSLIKKFLKPAMLERGLLKTKAMLEEENAQLRKKIEDLINGRALPFWQTATTNSNSNNNNNQAETTSTDCRWFPDHAM